jgi:hypothetical protein
MDMSNLRLHGFVIHTQTSCILCSFIENLSNNKLLKPTTMQKELLQKPQVEKIGKNIGYEAGEEMAKRFFDKHPEQVYVNTLGRELIEKILAQPGCAGITIVPGYDDKGIRQAIVVGVDNNLQPILNYQTVNISGEIETEDGIVGDQGFKTYSW